MHPSSGKDANIAEPSAAVAAAAGIPTDSSAFYRSSTLKASQIKRDNTRNTGCCDGTTQPQPRPQPMPSGAPFWRRFAARMHVLCLGELRHALMAHSCVGVPGVITLLSNLCVTSDFEVETLEKVRCRVRTHSGFFQFLQLLRMGATHFVSTYTAACSPRVTDGLLVMLLLQSWA
jgi:hypothetical protein